MGTLKVKPALGAWIAGGNSSDVREKDDFYSTPLDCTKALLAAERDYIRHRLVWEPACGNGAISKALIAQNINVYSSDLVDRGYGESRIDFLLEREPKSCAIITNPPFKLAEQFIRHAHSVNIDYMALLLKSTFWHAASRSDLYDLWKPARIHTMTWRPDFRDLGAPTMDCIWVVWDGNSPKTDYSIMRRPQ